MHACQLSIFKSWPRSSSLSVASSIYSFNFCIHPTHSYMRTFTSFQIFFIVYNALVQVVVSYKLNLISLCASTILYMICKCHITLIPQLLCVCFSIRASHVLSRLGTMPLDLCDLETLALPWFLNPQDPCAMFLTILMPHIC